jgi:hypothetical protein
MTRYEITTPKTPGHLILFDNQFPEYPQMFSGRKHVVYLTYKKYGIKKHLHLLANFTFRFPVYISCHDAVSLYDMNANTAV